MGTTRRITPRKPKKQKPEARVLAEATFAAWAPFLNAHDPGRKFKSGEVFRTVSALAARQLKQHRGGETPEGYEDGQHVYHPRRYWSGVLGVAKVERHIAGEETWYYSSSRRGYAVPYLDTDAHNPIQVPDVPRAVALIDSLMPGLLFSRSSDRGWNHYLKVWYGGRQNIPEYNSLTARLQAAVRALFRRHDISCDFETKGKVTTDEDKDSDDCVRGVLGKLPFGGGWTWDDLRAWAATPVLSLVPYRELVGRLEALAGVEPGPPTVKGRRRVRVLEHDRRDQPADRFRANTLDLMAIARRLRRVPDVEEALQYLHDNGLYTGEWEDNEAARERRVAWILDHYVEPGFDADKCLGFPIRDITALVDRYVGWARRKYGDTVPALVGGRLVNLDTVRLGAYLGLCVWCLEQSPNKGDGGIPYRRLEALWQELKARGVLQVGWSHEYVYQPCRAFLDSHDILVIADRSYGPGRSMRYAHGEWFPGRYQVRQQTATVAGEPLDLETDNQDHHTLSICVQPPLLMVNFVAAPHGRDPPD